MLIKPPSLIFHEHIINCQFDSMFVKIQNSYVVGDSLFLVKQILILTSVSQTVVMIWKNI